MQIYFFFFKGYANLLGITTFGRHFGARQDDAEARLNAEKRPSFFTRYSLRYSDWNCKCPFLNRKYKELLLIFVQLSPLPSLLDLARMESVDFKHIGYMYSFSCNEHCRLPKKKKKMNTAYTYIFSAALKQVLLFFFFS